MGSKGRLADKSSPATYPLDKGKEKYNDSDGHRCYWIIITTSLVLHVLIVNRSEWFSPPTPTISSYGSSFVEGIYKTNV